MHRRMRAGSVLITLLLGLVGTAVPALADDAVVPAVLSPATHEPSIISAVYDEGPDQGVNKDGTPLILPAGYQIHTQGQPQASFLVPESEFVCDTRPASVVRFEFGPTLGIDLFRHCLGLGAFEPLAPLSSSGTSRLDSALVGNRVIFRYDSSYGMKHPDRAEYYMARNRSVPTGGGRGLRLPETNVDAQELSTYLEMAFSQRFSAFVEMPARFLNLEVNKDYYGWGDLNAGFKLTYCIEEQSLMTALFRVYTPVGDAYHGLGTGHTALEPGFLVYERLTPNLVLELEVKDWIPLGGTISAGNVLSYGAALTLDLYETAGGLNIKPVAELQGWTVLRGMQTEVYPTADPFSYITFESENRDTVINGSLGMRLGGANGDVFLGYSKGLTGPKWFENALRLEFRWFY